MLLIGFAGIVFVVSRRCSIPLERRLGIRSARQNAFAIDRFARPCPG
jgi:hypothetical protein